MKETSVAGEEYFRKKLIEIPYIYGLGFSG
jgi:hypothetical protein